jgi:hypothetical protein
MKISIGTLGNKRDFRSIEVKELSKLEEIILKSPYSLGTYKNNHRNKENFISTELIGLDFDEGVKIDEAVELFKEYKHIIAPTKSHRVEKNGKVCDRFRVILFLTIPIRDNETFDATWYSLFQKFPKIDKACKDSCRYFDPSISIYSKNLDQGVTVDPASPEVKEASEKSQVKLGPEQRGKLGNRTLNFLTLGAAQGQRHTELFFAARDAHQNLFPKEWFVEKVHLLSESLGDPAYVDDGALKSIDDAFSKEPRHEPRVKPRAFSYMKLGDLLDIEDKPDDWLVEGLLIKGGLSIIVGVPKIGKTTLVRQLEKCILRGDKFLDRKTHQGSVVHYSFDEKAKTAKRHYQKLGLTKDDALTLHFGAASNSEYLKELEEDLLTLKPSIAVVDTLFDLVETDDVNSYGPVKRQLSGISGLAERTGCHIMFIHHQNKPNPNFGRGSGHSVLGSTAIFGSVDCCLIFEQVKDSGLRTLAIKGRGVEDFDRMQLRFQRDSQTYIVEHIEDEF